jgi:anti-anti-sigma factor
MERTGESDGNRLEVVLTHVDAFVRVKLRGDLDYGTTVQYAEALRAVTDIRKRVVLDLAEVTFIDSVGLRFLVILALGHDGPMRLEHVSPSARAVLTPTGLGDVFELPPEP